MARSSNSGDLLKQVKKRSEEVSQRESEYFLMANDESGGAGSILLAFYSAR
jgi:hypothetical protein